MFDLIKKNIKPIFIIFIIILALYFSISILRGVLAEDFTSYSLESGVYSDFVSVPGIALREEELIISNSDFVNVSYLAEDGSRVSKSSSIASFNTVKLSADTISQIDKLNRKIYQLNSSVQNTVVYDIVTLDSHIKTNINTLLDAMENNSLKDILDASSEAQIWLNKKDIRQNGVDTYLSRLDYYQGMKDSLLDNNSTTEKYVYAPNAGFFYSGYDGYEYIKYSENSKLTVAEFNALMELPAEPIQPSFVGKLQSSPEWHFVGSIPAAEARQLTVGKAVTLEFDIKHIGSKQLTFYVEFISAEVNGICSVDFSCQTLNSELFTLRKETAKLITTSYSGFQIRNDSIRLNDGVQGIYVLSAKRVVFKPINILYSGTDFSIVESENKSGSRSLQVNDEVIVGGKDLYDGKVVGR